MLVRMMVILIVSAALNAADDSETIYIDNHKHCVEISAVNTDLLERAYEGEVVDDAALRKYFRCFFQKSGFQNEKGEMLVTEINKALPRMTQNPDETSKVILECESKKLTGSDPEDTAFVNFKCYVGAS